ncbi:hypothetical protein F2Q69_00004940 [Brassica cretica]|uniref:Uncharacterized protein n=1 Tax=Brassica cretica TaxID=69181 RepID=A0A8S9NR63_BRACR|nr:hypothetical protein F2Q69_00004940 [Brassica cretica]
MQPATTKELGSDNDSDAITSRCCYFSHHSSDHRSYFEPQTEISGGIFEIHAALVLDSCLKVEAS